MDYGLSHSLTFSTGLKEVVSWIFHEKTPQPLLHSFGKYSEACLVQEVQAVKEPSEWADSNLQLSEKIVPSMSQTKSISAIRNRTIE